MSGDCVLVEDSGAVRVVTLNRPEKRNAIDIPVRLELAKVLEAADADSSIRAIVLTRTFQLAHTPSAAMLEADPENRLLARYPARRMEAEAQLSVAEASRNGANKTSLAALTEERPEALLALGERLNIGRGLLGEDAWHRGMGPVPVRLSGPVVSSQCQRYLTT